MNKARRIASRTATAVLAVIVAAAVVLLLMHVLTSNGRSLPGGYRALAVLSGSMEPKLPVGSVVVSKETVPSSIRVGDIITFRETTTIGGGRSQFVTHRVVEITGENGDLSFVTKGDANNVADLDPVPGRNLVGRIVLTVPLIGQLSQFVRSPLGLILLILLPAGILIIWEGYDLIKGKKKRVREISRSTMVILGLSLLGFGLAGVAAGSPAEATEAYFSAATDPVEISITAGTWDEDAADGALKLTPGKAKAVRVSEETSERTFIPVASLDDEGLMHLDFGEVYPGHTNNSNDVFQIKNTGQKTLKITIEATDGFEEFVVSIRGDKGSKMPVTLRPGASCRVDIRLGVSKCAAAGDYEGNIRITSVDGSVRMKIPALVTVVGSPHKPDGEDDDNPDDDLPECPPDGSGSGNAGDPGTVEDGGGLDDGTGSGGDISIDDGSQSRDQDSPDDQSTSDDLGTAEDQPPSAGSGAPGSQDNSSRQDNSSSQDDPGTQGEEGQQPDSTGQAESGV